jgi:hypothetical protein
MARRVESVTCSQPVCSARPAASRFRRAFCVPILTRPAIRATQPWSLWQMCIKTLLQETNIELFSGQEPLTKSNENFPLELRAKTDRCLRRDLRRGVP